MRRTALLFLTLIGCTSTEATVGLVTQAEGEPQNGFPTPEERLGLMAINRARSDPNTVKGPQSTVFPPRPPVVWSYDLSRSSRFHAINLQLAKVSLMHDSPCPLNPNVSQTGCDGAPACACQSPVGQACVNCANVAPVNNGCGTPTFTRIGYFSAIATGEVAAAGYSDTFATVDGWVDEAAGSDGHRRNLLDQGITSNTMGFGHSSGAGCWSSFDVSDSGMQDGLAIPQIPTASPNPARPADSARFYATFADPAGPPQSLVVVVDGECKAMSLELGSPTLNSTWYSDVLLPPACHSWFVIGHDAMGNRSTYPTKGALFVGAGGVACPNDYSAQAPAASCEGAMEVNDLAMSHGRDLGVPKPRRDLATHPALGDGGPVGAFCESNGDCQSGVCVTVSGAASYCTAECAPSDPNGCPAGYFCGPIDTTNYCIASPSGGGGCGVGAGRGGGGPKLLALLALAALAKFLRGRRSRRGD